jgi:hypothetical protein
MRGEYNKLDNVFITYWEIQNLRISQYIKMIIIHTYFKVHHQLIESKIKLRT